MEAQGASVVKYLMAFFGVSIGLYFISGWNRTAAYMMVIAILLVLFQKIGIETVQRLFLG